MNPTLIGPLAMFQYRTPCVAATTWFDSLKIVWHVLPFNDWKICLICYKFIAIMASQEFMEGLYEVRSFALCFERLSSWWWW